MIQARRLRHAARVVSALVVAGVIASSGASIANAGPQHHGTDPAATGCNQNAAQISSRGVETPYGQVVATVQVFYSYSCQTNWIRVTGNPAGGATLKAIRTQGGAELVEVDWGTASSYSMQVYAPGSTCIEYQVALTYASGAHYAEAYDPARSWSLVC